jgi:predicted MPP superfamily phosphohydrolase
MPSFDHLPTAVTVALVLAACTGHLTLMVASHNWWYGQRFSKRVGDSLHLLHGVLFVAAPVALGLWQGADFLRLLDFGSESLGRQIAGAYLVVCWLAVGIGLPVDTLLRLLRKRPKALLAERAEVVDFASVLGYPPAGHGKRAWLTALPFNEAFQVEFAERTLCLPRLPAALDGLTILHLTDLHLSGTPDLSFFRALMDRCINPVPDLVCITGDLADGYKHQRWVVPVLGRLRWGLAAFAVLGNHDYWYDPPFIRRRLKRLGIRYLGNGWEQITIRGEPLIVIGHEGPWRKPAPDLSNCPAGPFRLCLSHTPDNIAWARRNAIDLMLSGHVHGGQIRLPVFGSVLVPSIYGRRYDCGTFDEGPTLLHVGRGISGEHAVRFLCRPEVTRLVLRHREERTS